VCVHLPRFELVAAAGGPEALTGRALAVAPSGSGPALVGEVSGTAQAQGVQAGMMLGEALARCPTLELVPGDPVQVAQSWEQAARALEGIGAQVELARPGLAYFDGDGLRGLHGGDEGLILATRKALPRPARIGVAPSRFCSLAAALETRTRRVRRVSEREVRRYLAAQPVGILSYRPQTATIVPPLRQLGLGKLGALVKLTAAEMTDRFGEPGTVARHLALGHDTPLQVRRVEDLLTESMLLGEANSGLLLERTLEVLVDRLLARPQRRGRTVRAITLSARLAERGTWREEVVFRQALCDPQRIRLALTQRLQLLPAPAVALQLAVAEFGPAGGDQGGLLDGERTTRLARLQEAVSQVRTLAGPNATLRALVADPRSRVPERKVLYAPWQQ
jgi:nucleotidyltransferase/DNA polymerase involved in DNA repair